MYIYFTVTLYALVFSGYILVYGTSGMKIATFWKV